PGRLRIAFTAGDKNGAQANRECVEVLERTARLCADLGHDVEEAAPELDGPLAWRTFLTLVAVGMKGNLEGHPTAGRPRARGAGEMRRPPRPPPPPPPPRGEGGVARARPPAPRLAESISPAD